MSNNSMAVNVRLLKAIQTGTMSKEIFKVHEYYKLFTTLASQNPEYKSLVNESDGDTISALAKLQDASKIAILRALASRGYLETQPNFWGIIPHFFKYTSTPITTVKVLDQNKPVPFNIDIPIDTLSTFMGFQLLDIEFEKPELDDSFVQQYGDTAKFSYTCKPGIRLFPDILFSSSTVPVQQYDYLDVLRYDKEYVRPEFYKQWNRLIGHDTYEFADVYNQAVEITYGVPTKNGYQTPKQDQDGLHVRVPLLFDHTKCFCSKFNLNSFLEGTLTISGYLAASKHMVKAEYYPDNVEDPTIELLAKPLRVKKFNLITLRYFVDDQLHALISNKAISKFVRYFGNKVGTIKNNDPDEMIPVDGKGYVEGITFCIRPDRYKDDFHLWCELSEVAGECSPTVCVTADGAGELKKLAIKPAKINKPIVSLDKISLTQDGDEIKPEFDPVYYADVEAFRNAREFDNYFPRDNMMYKFNFNYHLGQNLMSGMLVHSKLQDVMINYKFKDGYLDNNRLLKEKWQYIIYRDLCNQQYGVNSGLTTLYLL